MPPSSTERVHPVAKGFDVAAEAYERARPEYPTEALRTLAERLAIGPGSVVLDLAAGTGKLTRALRNVLDVRVIAVEPSAGMRSAFLAAVAGVPLLDGTAEAIPLGDGTVDAVVVGQAFHWFRPPQALAEIARVLKPGGGLGLLWNNRDERVGWVDRFGAILREVEHDDAPRARSASWQGAFTEPGPFGPLTKETCESAQPLPVGALVDRALSVSYVARLPDPEKDRVARKVRDLLRDDAELAGRATIEFPYVTEIYWTRRR